MLVRWGEKSIRSPAQRTLRHGLSEAIGNSNGAMVGSGAEITTDVRMSQPSVKDVSISPKKQRISRMDYSLFARPENQLAGQNAKAERTLLRRSTMLERKYLINQAGRGG